MFAFNQTRSSEFLHGWRSHGVIPVGRDIRRFLISAQSRASSEPSPGCSRLYPGRPSKPPSMETAQPLWATRSNARLSSCWKSFSLLLAWLSSLNLCHHPVLQQYKLGFASGRDLHHQQEVFLFKPKLQIIPPISRWGRQPQLKSHSETASNRVRHSRAPDFYPTSPQDPTINNLNSSSSLGSLSSSEKWVPLESVKLNAYGGQALQLLFWMSILPLTNSLIQVSPHPGHGPTYTALSSFLLCPIQQNPLWDVRGVVSEKLPGLKTAGVAAEGRGGKRQGDVD